MRDLGRHRRRSAAAVAVLAISLGLPATIVLASGSSEVAAADDPANLPANWVLLRPVEADDDDFFARIPAEPGDRGTGLADDVARVLPDATIAPVEFAVDADANSFVPPAGGVEALPVLKLRLDPEAVDHGIHYNAGSAVPWVANTDLLEILGIDPSMADSGADVLGPTEHQVALDTDIVLHDDRDDEIALATTEQIEPVEHTAITDYLLTPDAVAERGHRVELGGWLVASPTPITDEQADALAAVAGRLVVETHEPPASASGLRWATLAIGAGIALGVLAVMSALIRLDAERRERALAALGAGSRLRRRSEVATTAVLAFVAAGFAVPIGYLGLFAFLSDRPDDVHLAAPAGPMAVLLVGVPLAAVAATWILAHLRPEPPTRPVFS
ncbi:MAG: hypothetical protein S0880_07620 [Actinomycetota bacterium]|nr:hypothetical protein [Actinomycetota bacterium]